MKPSIKLDLVPSAVPVTVYVIACKQNACSLSASMPTSQTAMWTSVIPAHTGSSLFIADTDPNYCNATASVSCNYYIGVYALCSAGGCSSSFSIRASVQVCAFVCVRGRG